MSAKQLAEPFPRYVAKFLPQLDPAQHGAGKLTEKRSGTAWEYDEATDEYYLRLFCREQPDLNWENPAVRKAAHDVMRFWLDRGVDGFRIDVINFISKDQSFPDSNQRFLRGTEYYACGPRCHEYLKELGAILKEYDAFSVGEMPCVHDETELIKAVASDREELSMIFHFELFVPTHNPCTETRLAAGQARLRKLTCNVSKFIAWTWITARMANSRRERGNCPSSNKKSTSGSGSCTTTTAGMRCTSRITTSLAP